MLLAIGIKVALLSASLLGLLVPLRGRMLERSAEAESPTLGQHPDFYAGRPAIGLIRPLAKFLDAAAVPPRAGFQHEVRGFELATMLAVLAPFLAWSVIPFGAHYELGEGGVDLVVANLEAGALWLLVAACVSLWAGLLIQSDDDRRLRAAVMGSFQLVGMGLALVGVFLVFGSMNPIEIVMAQDRTLSLLPFITWSGLWMGWSNLPAWGVVYQPLAFGLYLVCGSLAISSGMQSPVARARAAGASGASIQLLCLAEHLQALVLAGVAVALFLGGGAIPYLPADRIVDFIAPHYGEGLATILCMAVHMAVFLGKVSLLIPLQIGLAARLRRSVLASSLHILWRGVIPVAFLNVLLTASILVARGMGG